MKNNIYITLTLGMCYCSHSFSLRKLSFFLRFAFKSNPPEGPQVSLFTNEPTREMRGPLDTYRMCGCFIVEAPSEMYGLMEQHLDYTGSLTLMLCWGLP